VGLHRISNAIGVNIAGEILLLLGINEATMYRKILRPCVKYWVVLNTKNY